MTTAPLVRSLAILVLALTSFSARGAAVQAGANDRTSSQTTMQWTPSRLREPGVEEAHRAARPFNAVAVVGRGALDVLEMRTRVTGQDWGDWWPVTLRDGPAARGGQQSSELAVVPLAQDIALRVAAGASSASLADLRVVLLATANGPEPAARLVAAQGDAPRIVPRSEWGADASLLAWTPEYQPVRKFAIHHTASSDGGSSPAASIRAIYRYHADTLGWGDIGYNYIIDRAGTIYEGRAGGPNVVAAHSGLHSAGADGIALLGNFQDVRPSEAMSTSLARLVAWRARSQGVDPRGSSFFVDRTLPNVFAHRDVATTDCPGDLAYASLALVRQQAAAFLGAPSSLASVSILGSRISPVSSSVGDTIQIEVTLRNGSGDTISSQGPEPGTVYGPRDTYLTLGGPEQAGRVRVAVEVEGSTGIDHRYRWGLGSPLPSQGVRTVTGGIRLDRPGTYRLWVGIVQEGIGWIQDNVGQTSVTVYSPGASSYAAASQAAAELYFPLVMHENPQPGHWSTRLALLNTTDRAATGTIVMLDREGRTVATVPLAIPPRGAVQRDMASVSGLPRGFAGAAVVRADVPLTGVALHDRPGADRMAVEPFTVGAGRLYAPLAARNYQGLSTGLQVQNLGSRATTANVTYIAPNGGSWSHSLAIAPLASATSYAPAVPGLPEGFIGSALVESADAPLAAVMNESRTGGLAMSYPALATGSTVATAPLLYRNRNGWSSGLQIQNLAGSPATATATFMPTNMSGGPWEQRGVIGYAISATYYLPGLPQLPDGLVTSAVVRAQEGSPLLTLAQSVHSAKPIGTAVSATPATGATLFVPLAMNDAEGWRTGLQVQNSGDLAAPVTLQFNDPAGATVMTLEDTVPGASARTYYLPSLLGLPVGFAGSVVIQGRSGAVLSAVVNDVR